MPLLLVLYEKLTLGGLSATAARQWKSEVRFKFKVMH